MTRVTRSTVPSDARASSTRRGRSRSGRTLSSDRGRSWRTPRPYTARPRRRSSPRAGSRPLDADVGDHALGFVRRGRHRRPPTASVEEPVRPEGVSVARSVPVRSGRVRPYPRSAIGGPKMVANFLGSTADTNHLDPWRVGRSEPAEITGDRTERTIPSGRRTVPRLTTGRTAAHRASVRPPGDGG